MGTDRSAAVLFRSPTRRSVVACLTVILVVHVSLLVWGAYRQSPVIDEVGHLAAGIDHWQLGQFRSYIVNPPLVRMVGAIPVLVARPETPWGAYTENLRSRPEFYDGQQFLAANGQRSFWLFTLARWACIPFSLLGAWVCWQWARELYGESAGIVAAALWCFSPNVIAYTQLILPDAGAAAMGVAAAYAFWRWLRRPGWSAAIAAGVVLGLTELTKLTWIVLFPLWPAIWVIWRHGEKRALKGPHPTVLPKGEEARRWPRGAGQLAIMLLLAVYLINVAYGFEGSLKRLGDFRFISTALGGPESPGEAEAETEGEGRNRFAETWLARIPVPLPECYVRGIDYQKLEFEQKKWSYLNGQWRFGGWWYYYLYAMAVKVPLGTWVLAGMAVGVGLAGPCRSHNVKVETETGAHPDALPEGERDSSGLSPLISGSSCYSAGWRDELMVLAPLAAVLVLVSSQTGFNHHLRYVLPIFPFAFIWVSKVARAVSFRHWKVALIAAVALTWSIGSSLWVYPHSMSYFNELVGGPLGGHYHLNESNSDWGQDLLYLKRWLDEHPEARPLTLSHGNPLVDPKLAGIEYTGGPPRFGPEPGWHAISVNYIHNANGEYEYFLKLKPVAMAGYSIYIYHVTLEEANRVRREFGLEELPKDWRPAEGAADGQVEQQDYFCSPRGTVPFFVAHVFRGNRPPSDEEGDSPQLKFQRALPMARAAAVQGRRPLRGAGVMP